MRRFLPIAFLSVALLATPAPAYNVVLTHETLVLASAATALPQTAGRTAIEIQNLGPNPIYCSVGESTADVTSKARMVEANGGKWALKVSADVPIYCKAGTADQVTGAATITTELR